MERSSNLSKDAPIKIIPPLQSIMEVDTPESAIGELSATGELSANNLAE